jgi:hypothetical protein
VVVRWRVRVTEAEGGGTPARLKVIRPVGGSYLGISTSATRTIADPAPGSAVTYIYATSQPIRAGDLVALDLSGPNNNTRIRSAPQVGTTQFRWQPPLANGETRPPNQTFTDAEEHMFNADVEPDCDNDGLGDETQDTNLSSCAPGTGPGTGPGAGPVLGPGGTPVFCKGKPATIVGTAGNDVRTGSKGRDVIASLGGNDTLSGLGGKDLICGGPGKDKLFGGKGKDKLYGQKGKDTLNGGKGNDLCAGGPGKDKAKGCEKTKSI